MSSIRKFNAKNIICGLPGITSKVFYIYQNYFNKFRQSYVWIIGDINEIKEINKAIEFWNLVYNDRQVNTKILDCANKDFFYDLYNIYQQKFDFYFLNINFINEWHWLYLKINWDKFLFNKNTMISLKDFKKFLLDMGYEFYETQEKYYCNIRGNLIYIYSDNVYRLEFLDNNILNIKLILKNAIKDLDSVFIYPADMRDFLLNQNKYNLLNSVNNISKNPIYVYNDNQNKEYGDNYQKSQRLLNNLLDFNKNSIVFYPFKRTKVKKSNIELAKSYHKDLELFATDIREYIYKDWKIIFALREPDVIKNILNYHGIDYNSDNFMFKELNCDNLDGFLDHEQKIVLLTHFNIFSNNKFNIDSKLKQLKKKHKKTQIEFIASLKSGDYIVHEDHGIGIFKKIIKKIIGGYKKELIVLQYADKDKLYIPVEMSNKLDKYIGRSNPKVHKLSGVSWNKVKNKIKQQTHKLAKELLTLYAKREIIKVKKWEINQAMLSDIESSFPYKETKDQIKTLNEVYNDLKGVKPMDRLVVGDVGFGKTEVALRTAYIAVLNGYQVAFLCPTTILAGQHFNNFKRRLNKLGFNVAILSRFTKKLEKTTESGIIQNLKLGQIDIIIGTHRLLSRDVKINNLGLLILDEEQKFGVKHKEKIKQLKENVQVLTLSATPIPRTLYFALSGLREISMINEPPQGRQSPKIIINEYDTNLILKAVNFEIQRGGQVFYVYNKVQNIQSIAKKLKKLFKTDKIRFGVAHGQLKEQELINIMDNFYKGKIDVLVCSSIIENGIDLANVNTLIVHDSTRFGLGQLYQLKGRIGRGNVLGYAYFFYNKQKLSLKGQDRLQALQDAEKLGSGLQLAMRDLEIRGIGNILGAAQHGDICDIGLNLYAKLIYTAISKLKGETVEDIDREVNINLPLDYGIDESLVCAETERLKLYKKLSLIENIEKLRNCKKTLYKKLEKKFINNLKSKIALNNLFSMFEIKLAIKYSDVNRIDYTKVKVGYNKYFIRIFVYLSNQLSKKQISEIKHFNADWQVKNNILSVSLDKMNKNWTAELLRLIKFVSK